MWKIRIDMFIFVQYTHLNISYHYHNREIFLYKNRINYILYIERELDTECVNLYFSINNMEKLEAENCAPQKDVFHQMDTPTLCVSKIATRILFYNVVLRISPPQFMTSRRKR